MQSAHRDSVDSLEAGRITREIINPSTRSRDRQAGPNRPGNPNRRAIAATAATCPCGSERVMVHAASAGTSACPFSVASIASIASAGSLDRLARVSWRTFLPSR
uniref:Uncharacterized protein n=1 Tax=Mycobacterium riyadhense TaxID=486698 RepID=A0A653F4B9_9MYCO|nr:hypothetical protein BIN_B_05288 [Mycobacterium riyadhense]